MADEQVVAFENDFVLGDPALVCRWRLASSKLVMASRHLRALRDRTVNGKRVSTQLVAWAKQHIEWTLEGGAAENPDGVLMLVIDSAGQAAMSIGPYKHLEITTSQALASRASSALLEAQVTNVPPETIWAVRNGVLYQGIGDDMRSSGSASLVRDLAKTLGITMVREPDLAEAVHYGSSDIDEVMLTSDEHGIIAASNLSGPTTRRFAESYLTLLSK